MPDCFFPWLPAAFIHSVRELRRRWHLLHTSVEFLCCAKDKHRNKQPPLRLREKSIVYVTKTKVRVEKNVRDRNQGEDKLAISIHCQMGHWGHSSIVNQQINYILEKEIQEKRWEVLQEPACQACQSVLYWNHTQGTSPPETHTALKDFQILLSLGKLFLSVQFLFKRIFKEFKLAASVCRLTLFGLLKAFE